MTDLTSQESHFAFGENWSAFSKIIDADRIAQSDQGLAKLLPAQELHGKTVIDIGCGSGLPALSMLRAGAKHVTCVDIDPASVRTASEVLGAQATEGSWTAKVVSVFELEGAYDVVYSWGVLHHTGDMWRAIDKAANLVKPGGTLAIALYYKTPLCGFWRVEKRIYRSLPRPLQALACAAVLGLRVIGQLVRLRDPLAPFKAYRGRGMNAWHDQHDWLGGYPYESATPDEVHNFLSERGLSLTRQNLQAGGRSGVGGSGCDEYVFRRAV